MLQWETIESKLPKFRTQRQKRQMAVQVKFITFFVLTCSLVEHILNIISIVHYSTTCLHQENPTEEFFKVQLSQLFAVIPFSFITAVFGKIINIIATFAWSYTDLFVMLISTGLAFQFKQLNQDLQNVKGEVSFHSIHSFRWICTIFSKMKILCQHMSEDYWELRRLQYRKLSALCFMVDDAISQITVISFANDLFFICVQLLRSIR